MPIATREKTSAPVHAQTPFLTIPQVAAELGASELETMRLVARESLPSTLAGDALKIRPADLDAYARAGSPDFEAPEFSESESWFQDRGVASQARQFLMDVRGILFAQFPDSVPRLKSGQIVRDFGAKMTPELQALIRRQPFGQLAKLPGQAARPYRTAAEVYIADKLLASALNQIRSEPVNAHFGGGSFLHRLYASPQKYQQFARTAWMRIRDSAITMTRDYPLDDRPGRPVRVTMRLPHEKLGVNIERVARVTF